MSAESYPETMSTNAETAAHLDPQQFWRRLASMTAEFVLLMPVCVLLALLLRLLLPDDLTANLLAASACVVGWRAWRSRRRNAEAAAGGSAS